MIFKEENIFQFIKNKNIILPQINIVENSENKLETEENPQFWGVLNAINSNFSEINKIMSDLEKDNNWESAQEKLENLSAPLLSKVKNKIFQIPKHVLSDNSKNNIADSINDYITREKEKKHLNASKKIFIEKLQIYLTNLKSLEEYDIASVFILAIYQIVFEEYFLCYKKEVKKLNFTFDLEKIHNTGKDATFGNENKFIVKQIDVVRKVATFLNNDALDLGFKSFIIKNRSNNKDMEETFNSNEVNFLPDLEKELYSFIIEVIDSTEILQSEEINLSISRYKMYSIDQEFLKNSLELPIYSPNLPMLISPEPWKRPKVLENKIEEENSQELGKYINNPRFCGIHSGGYLKNKKDEVRGYSILEGISRISQKSYAIPSDKSIEAVNFLQLQKYRINEEMLKDFNDNTILYIKMWLEALTNEIDYSDFIEFDEKNTSCTIMELKEYVLKKIKNYGTNLTKKQEKAIKSKYLQIYRTLTFSVCECIYLLIIANYFRGKDLHFVWFFCLRGRLYAHGYLLFPQGSSLSKAILDLQPLNSEKSEKLTPEGLKSANEYKESILKSTKLKDKFIKRRIELGIDICTIPIDATASGASIIGGLCGSMDALLDTNVLKLKGDIDIKKDPYNKVLTNIYKRFKNIELNPNKQTKDIYLLELKKFFERSTVKDFCICYIYSEGTHSRIEKLKEWYDKQKADTHQLRINSNEKALYSAYVNAEKFFLDSMREVYPDLVEFRTIFMEIFGKNKVKSHAKDLHKNEYDESIEAFQLSKNSFLHDVNKNENFSKQIKSSVISAIKEEFNNIQKITWDKILSSSNQPYLVVVSNSKRWISLYRTAEMKTQKVKQKSYKSGEKEKTFTLQYDSNELDANKIKLSCIPHFIHNIDSSILLEVILCCKSTNLPIYSAHDSFYCFPNDVQKIKQFYFENYIEIILIEDPIATYFKFNRIILDHPNDKPLRKLFNSYLEEKSKIFKKIKENSLEMNNKILS